MSEKELREKIAQRLTVIANGLPLDESEDLQEMWESSSMGFKSFAMQEADSILSLLREEGVDLEGWRPIESAPKDGTPIDLLDDDDDRWADCYWGLPTHSCGEAGSYCDSEIHAQEDGWIYSLLNEQIEMKFKAWRPLPAPPLSALETRNGEPRK